MEIKRFWTNKKYLYSIFTHYLWVFTNYRGALLMQQFNWWGWDRRQVEGQWSFEIGCCLVYFAQNPNCVCGSEATFSLALFVRFTNYKHQWFLHLVLIPPPPHPRKENSWISKIIEYTVVLDTIKKNSRH